MWEALIQAETPIVSLLWGGEGKGFLIRFYLFILERREWGVAKRGRGEKH